MEAAAPTARTHLETIRILPTPLLVGTNPADLGVNLSWFK